MERLLLRERERERETERHRETERDRERQRSVGYSVQHSGDCRSSGSAQQPAAAAALPSLGRRQTRGGRPERERDPDSEVVSLRERERERERES